MYKRQGVDRTKSGGKREMEKKQGVKGRRLLFALFLTGAVLLGLAGCSENIGGTVYLSGVSRLRDVYKRQTRMTLPVHLAYR